MSIADRVRAAFLAGYDAGGEDENASGMTSLREPRGPESHLADYIEKNGPPSIDNLGTYEARLGAILREVQAVMNALGEYDPGWQENLASVKLMAVIAMIQAELPEEVGGFPKGGMAEVGARTELMTLVDRMFPGVAVPGWFRAGITVGTIAAETGSPTGRAPSQDPNIQRTLPPDNTEEAAAVLEDAREAVDRAAHGDPDIRASELMKAGIVAGEELAGSEIDPDAELSPYEDLVRRIRIIEQNLGLSGE